MKTKLTVILCLLLSFLLLAILVTGCHFAPLATIEINDNSQSKTIDATLPVMP